MNETKTQMPPFSESATWEGEGGCPHCLPPLMQDEVKMAQVHGHGKRAPRGVSVQFFQQQRGDNQPLHAGELMGVLCLPLSSLFCLWLKQQAGLQHTLPLRDWGIRWVHFIWVWRESLSTHVYTHQHVHTHTCTQAHMHS